MSSDYDVRGTDLDQRYARWCLRPLTDQEIWNLGKASIVCPSPHGIAAKMFLTSRSTTVEWAEEIRDWAAALGNEIAKAMYLPKGGKRRVIYSRIESESVRRQAALDGVAIALFGVHATPTLWERRTRFGVDERAYRKIRDFVGGAAVNLIANFRFALEWAWGYSTSREFDRLFEALGCGEFTAWDSLDLQEGEEFSFARLKRSEGNYLTPMLPTNVGNEEPINLPILVNDRGFYDDRYEARMRAEALEAESTHGTESPVEHETRGAEITPHPIRTTGRRETHQPAGRRTQRSNEHRGTLKLNR